MSKRKRKGTIENSAKKLANARKLFEAFREFLAKTNSRIKASRPSILKYIISIDRLSVRFVTQFKSFIVNDSSLKQNLKPLWDALDRIGISKEEFFKLVDLEKILRTEYMPGGKVNEVLLFNNKKFMKFLSDQYAEPAIEKLILGIKEALENPRFDASWRILNAKNNKLTLKDINQLKKLPTKVATDFFTGQTDPKVQYLDGALVKYDSKSGKLLIVNPLQFKSPSNAGDLRDQIAQTVERLKKDPFIKCLIDGKEVTIKSENVFVLAGESVGVFYGNINKSFDPVNMKVYGPDNMLEKIDAKPKFTMPADPKLQKNHDFEFFTALKVQYKSGLTPRDIEKVLLQMKLEFLKRRR